MTINADFTTPSTPSRKVAPRGLRRTLSAVALCTGFAALCFVALPATGLEVPVQAPAAVEARLSSTSDSASSVRPATPPISLERFERIFYTERQAAVDVVAGYQATKNAAVDAGKISAELAELAEQKYSGAIIWLGIATDLDDVAAATPAADTVSQTVDEAIAEWDAAEAARVAAEEAAAAEAARVAAEEAAAAAAAAPAAPVSNGGVDYWAASYVSGWQSEINQCNSLVDVSGEMKLSMLAAHWDCGGSSFPTSAGTTVQLDGNYAGTYEVVGVAGRYVHGVHTSADLPRGYDLLFQTCWNGDSSDMVVIALQRI